MRIWNAPYTLVARSALSGKAFNKIRIGSLLKVEVDGAIGYADLHPWPEFGDAPVDEQLKLLAEGKTTGISARSLKLAELDRQARVQGLNAFEGLEVPESHYLVPDIVSLTEDELEGVWSAGFRTLKFKFGKKLQTETKRLNDLEKSLARFKLRMDFAGLLMAAEFTTFVDEIPESLLENIEYVEDPMPWNDSLWEALREIMGTKFALDRLSENELSALEFKPGPTKAFEWMIIKPAVQTPQRLANLARSFGARIAVTSYLDHPVGQVCAALEAVKLVQSDLAKDIIGTCGLVSHLAFDTNEFSEQLGLNGSRLLPPPGFGIGFDEVFERQDWSELK